MRILFFSASYYPATYLFPTSYPITEKEFSHSGAAAVSLVAQFSGRDLTSRCAVWLEGHGCYQVEAFL